MGRERAGSEDSLSDAEEAEDGAYRAPGSPPAEAPSSGDERGGAGAGGRRKAVDEDEEDLESATQERLLQRREENVRALLGNTLQMQRKPLLPKLLDLKGAELTLRAPFKSPHPTAPDRSQALQQRLAKRRIFIPWGSTAPLPTFAPKPLGPAAPDKPVDDDEVDTNPLTLWTPPEGAGGQPVHVDKMLTKWLRPHQREGLAFLFSSVTGPPEQGRFGCILADDMGLGKTLQGIALMWTLLQNGHALLGGAPLARRIVICCPTSLVANWDSECIKWLKGRVRTLPLCESSREEVESSVAQFLHPRNEFQVMIVSYETFRLHAHKFQGPGSCDLLLCDEAHRLKNDATLTNKALANMHCKRRVLLSGTPMQNKLDEFFAMVNFCNPGVLGTNAEFRKRFQSPILAGREPDATDKERELGAERSGELSAAVNPFILRRTNALLSAHLPPKVIEVVCCRMTPLQQELYSHFLASTAARKILSSGKKSARVLPAITALKKLCNHPKLIYDMVHGGGAGGEAKADSSAEGFKDCQHLFPPGLFDDGRPGRSRGIMPEGWAALSGKFGVLAAMLERLRPLGDRIVIVSNYTQTLDLFAQLCRDKGYPMVRLDGSCSIPKRQKLVAEFCDPTTRQFVFLLSSKAGGCGLNLVGANRLVLFDPDWNPATDKQAAGRVWRDGQRKRVYVYRFLTTGSIEEKARGPARHPATT